MGYGAQMRLVLVQPELSFDPDANNLDVLARLLDPAGDGVEPDDVVLLPEHFDRRTSRTEYEIGVRQLALRFGCHVVGGSHHEQRDGQLINSGIVVDGSGEILSTYEKLRPYADERFRVRAGGALGEVTIAGHPMLILICADFWFSDVFFRAHALPELVLVPSLSVSRKPSPEYSRALWRQLCVSRAYEFGVFVGVSDWAYQANAPRPRPSGVAGLADPTQVDPDAMFTPIGGPVRTFTLDLDALAAFRRDRQQRGFFWKPTR
jgi:predicted amidohydrolase